MSKRAITTDDDVRPEQKKIHKIPADKMVSTSNLVPDGHKKSDWKEKAKEKIWGKPKKKTDKKK